MPIDLPTIHPVDGSRDEAIRAAVDDRTKPVGSLGRLEDVAVQVARIQGTTTPRLARLAHVVFAADHGVQAEGVSPYPAEVTRQMVLNFLAGGAAINVFCRLHDVDLLVVDAGIDGPALPTHPALVVARLGPGTGNLLGGPALTPEQHARAVEVAVGLVDERIAAGADALSFGEMGIGNTTAGAALMAACLDLDAESCVGAGTGADPVLVAHKADVVRRGLALHRPALDSGAAVMQHLGGFELAMLAAGMAAAAARGRPFLVDGFLATAALLTVWRDQPAVLDHAVFGHVSDERGHRRMLEALGVTPLLDLGMRLGEGTGAVLAWPLVRAAAAMLTEMASFGDAGVDTGVDTATSGAGDG
jgi:nicotinate-nucleotide--dimethylbenzimidazole phosphoribosyltransferase